MQSVRRVERRAGVSSAASLLAALHHDGRRVAAPAEERMTGFGRRCEAPFIGYWVVDGVGGVRRGHLPVCGNVTATVVIVDGTLKGGVEHKLLEEE